MNKSMSRKKIRGNGAANAVSRYSKLMQNLDAHLFNQNWYEVDTSKIISKKEKYNFVDLFAGAGGLSLGFVQANFNKVLSNEINPFASATVKRNFPNSVHIGKAIEKATDEEILNVVGGRTIHVLIGGPPCQGFSVAGLRREDDPRNVMFLQFLRIAKLLQPHYVLMENVPGIITIKKGRVKEAILSEFESAGYPGCSVRILEAATYGVPQLRTRAIFIANKFSLKNPYPKPLLSRENYIPIEDAISDLISVGREPSINHEWTDHSKVMIERISKIPAGGSLYETYQDAYKRQYLGVPSMTIKENHGGTHLHPILDRCISAREMARLQTF